MIEDARRTAADQKINLNIAFREWLVRYVAQNSMVSSSGL